MVYWCILGLHFYPTCSESLVDLSFEAEGIVRFETLVVGFQQDQVTKAPSETRSVPLR